MNEIHHIAISTEQSPLDQSIIDSFKANLRGELIQPGIDGYDQARTVWNAMVDKRPALIVRSTGAADVLRAVQFACAQELLIAVRGGGHNVAGTAVCDGGLMIDLSLMKGIRVDPEQRILWAEPGLTWAEVDHETQAFGLATTGGTVSHTGIAGLTLGGRYGCLHALTCTTSDNPSTAHLIAPQC